MMKACTGVPVQMTTDKGSEIGWQFALQGVARYVQNQTTSTLPERLL